MNNVYGGLTGFLPDANGVSHADQLLLGAGSQRGINYDGEARTLGDRTTISGMTAFNWPCADPVLPAPPVAFPPSGLAIGWNRSAGAGETDLFCASSTSAPGALRVFALKSNQPPAWIASHAYAVNDTITASPTVGGVYVYTCTTAGTSATTAPAWPTHGTVTESTGVVWAWTSLNRPNGVIVPSANGSIGQIADITGNGVIRAYGAFAASGLTRVSATSGVAYTIPDYTSPIYFINGLALPSLPVTMPPNPVHGQEQTIITRGGITAFTLSPNAGQTIFGAPTTMAANTALTFIYDSTDSFWLPR
jgi:hypothetical protein